MFSCFTTTTNIAWLHTDGSMLPAQARARASWNYRLANDPDAPPTVTYDLNRLQGLTTPEQYCVTLNPDGGIDERRTAPARLPSPLHRRGDPRATPVAEVSGVNRTHYCGVLVLRLSRGRLNSALRAARALGSSGDRLGLFVGTLRHRRFTPVAHAFTYPLFMALLDIDRVPELMRVSAVTSYNRWNWASFDDRDHLGDPPTAQGTARDRCGAPRDRSAGRPIFLLTNLRYLGYCFNPVSFFYCFDRGSSCRSSWPR